MGKGKSRKPKTFVVKDLVELLGGEGAVDRLQFGQFSILDEFFRLPNGFLVKEASSLQIPNILSGPVKRRFTRTPLDGYRLVRQRAARYPLVPVIEMYGLPRPDANLLTPSITRLMLAVPPLGADPLRSVPGLKAWRDVQREVVEGKLFEMRCLREAQREVLLSLPGVRGAPKDIFDTNSVATRAALFWGVICDLLSWVLTDHVASQDDRRGGVYAPREFRASTSDRPPTVEELSEFWNEFFHPNWVNDPESVGFRLKASLLAARSEILSLEERWQTVFWEAVEAENMRQQCELILLVATQPFPSQPDELPSLNDNLRDCLERTVSVLLEHDGRPGALLHSPGERMAPLRLKVYPEPKRGRAGRFVASPHDKMRHVFGKVDVVLGKRKDNTYSYIMRRFNNSDENTRSSLIKILGFQEWTVDMGAWYAFAERYANTLVATNSVMTVTYTGSAGC